MPTSTPVPERASAKDTIVLLRAALKKRWPAATFSVTMSRGTGYGYCSVRWTDGPTESRVRELCMAFEGERFDGMDDSHRPTGNRLADGRRAGLRGVLTSRHESIDAIALAGRAIRARYPQSSPASVFVLRDGRRVDHAEAAHYVARNRANLERLLPAAPLALVS